MDAIVKLLVKLGWASAPDMTPSEGPAKPVFQLGQWKVVIGPVWTTYYRLVGETTYDMDSVRTGDVAAVEAKLKELSVAPVRPATRRSGR